VTAVTAEDVVVRLHLGALGREVRDSFDDLPVDDYLRGSFPFRRRRYSRARAEGGEVCWLAAGPFRQSAAHNAYAEGKARRFKELDDVVRGPLAGVVVPALLAHLPAGVYDVGVHQVRVLADDEHVGEPAPEGVHQDGFDYIGIVPVRRDNVRGGVTQLFDLDDRVRPVAEYVLTAGEVLLFNDRQLAHYTSPIAPHRPGLAVRDVFVLTFRRLTTDC
jgi:hypothetical protein